MNSLVIKCNNQAEKTAAASLCGTFGYIFDGGGNIHDLIKEGSSLVSMGAYPNVVVRKTGARKTFDFTAKDNEYASYHHYSWNTDLEKIINHINQDNFVKISKDYNAVVTKKGIKVGCQTIEFEDFDKL